MPETTEHFKRSLPVETFPRSRIEQISDMIEFGLRVDGEIGSLGKVLPDESVGVLDGSPLPGTVGIGEIDVHGKLLGDIGVQGHLLAPVVGQGLSEGFGYPAELSREPVVGALGVGALHLGQYHQSRRPLDDRTDRGAVPLAFDEIRLPMAGYDTGFDFGRSLGDRNHIRYLSPAVLSSRSRPAFRMTVPEQGDESGTKFAPRGNVDGAVDGLVGHLSVHGRRVGSLEPCGYLFRRPAEAELSADTSPEPGIGEFAYPPRNSRTSNRPEAGRSSPVLRRGCSISGNLPADGRRRAIKETGNLSDTDSLDKLSADFFPFISIQLTVLFSHATTLPPLIGKVLQLEFEPGV